MKRLLYSAALLAAMVSCQKMEEQNLVPSSDKEISGVHTISVTAGFVGSDTKTQIEGDDEKGYTFKWVKNDVVRIWETVKDGDMASVTSTIAETTDKVEFSVSFPERQKSQYKYFGVYPGNWDTNNSFKDLNGEEKFRIRMSPTQKMRNDCFDPSSDLLVSKTVTKDKQPSELNLQFGRVGAILKMNLRGLDASKYVRSVKFQADVPIAGYSLFDPSTETYTVDNTGIMPDDPSYYVYLYVDQLGDAGFDSGGKNFTVWLRCYPAQVREFTVEVTSFEDQGGRGTPITTFRRVNIDAYASGKPVQLLDGKMTSIIVDMSKECTPTGVSITSKPDRLTVGNSYQFTCALTPLEAGAKVDWSTSDSDIASVDAFGKVTAIGGGQVTITCTVGGVSDSYTVPVDETTPETVDLGLPSGTLWATCNLGASTPTGYGWCYPWGDPLPDNNVAKSQYKFMNYSTNKDDYLAGRMTKYSYDGAYASGGVPDCKRYLDAEDDPATTHLGGDWRSPTIMEFSELNNECYKSCGVLGGVSFVRFTSKTNENSIIIPLSGYNGTTDRASKIKLWTCETIPSWDYNGTLTEDKGVHTDISQNMTTWSKARSGYSTTYNKWAASYVIQATDASSITMDRVWTERYWHGYYIRPVKKPSVTDNAPDLRIESVEASGSGTSAQVTLEMNATKPSSYKIGIATAGSSASGTCSETYLQNVTVTGNTVTGTLYGLASGTEYSIYAHAGNYYSDNRVRFTPQVDQTTVLTAITTDPSSLSLKIGDKITLTPVYTPSTAVITSGPVYISNDTSVAYVDYNTGLVTATGAGTTTIVCKATGTNGLKEYYCPVTVVESLDFGDTGSSGSDINDDDVNNGGNF